MQKKHIELAVKNIARYGDTDIFPFPFENHMFHDEMSSVTQFIVKLHRNFTNAFHDNPAQIIRTCSPVGYNGLRLATQIEPQWNAYFLSLVLSIFEEIETLRIPVSENIVHSYRMKFDFEDGSLFNQQFNWHSFQNSSLEMVKEESSKYQYVVICDIADFYNRIYHHTLETLLKGLSCHEDIPKRIKFLLAVFSDGTSYGLPVGGAASRILAEFFLTNIDNLMMLKGITFKRFVDDIHIFAESLDKAHSSLNKLAITMMTTEGLTLQKHKTQILTRKEFIHIVESKLSSDSEDSESKIRTQFMALPINYDPYSESPAEDYERIKNELEKFDILELLNSELRKSRIHQAFSKHLLKSFKALDSRIVSLAFESISERLEHLAPVFPNIMMAAFANFDKLESTSKKKLMDKLRELFESDSYLLQLELNVTYLIRVLGKEKSPSNERLLNQIYEKYSDSILVKSWVIQIYGRWGNIAWLNERKSNFSSMSNWEKRAYFLASFNMGEKGEHWRKVSAKLLIDFHKIIADWLDKKNSESNWQLPL